jgi:signal transduction histidine kinase
MLCVVASTEHEASARRLVMVVDDDADIRELMVVTLQDRGYEVIEYSNGLDALVRLRTPCKPDVIVLDLMMPIMDGWEFRVAQRRDPALAAIPVVALSADTTSKAAAIDADAYLRKPALPDSVADAVDRLTLEIDRRALQAKLVQVDRLSSLGTLAAGMAHEINNPLAYTLLNLEFLQWELPHLFGDATSQESVTERRRRAVELLHVIQEGAERIRDIVRGLKDFSRPELETCEPIDMLALMERSIAMVAHEIRCRAQLKTTFDRDLPAVVGNAGRLGQVFLNLLLNAVQALADDESVHHEIRVVVTSQGDSVVVEIFDTGVGIAPEIRGRIFEPFFTTKPVGSGTGLGLAICHGIVVAHGGSIAVDSEVGKGSCFRVQLPAARGVRIAAHDRKPAQAATRARILLVDDEPNIGTIIKQLLEPEHTVETLSDARDACARILSGERYDVILCDVMMPGMDGPALYRAVCDVAPDQASRIAFVTGGAFTERARKFLGDVANPCLEKPFTVESLHALIRSMRRPMSN